MATRRRKTRRLRGSRCHGWGRSGQHRDSGMQGGHGNAGWKRHRWSSVIRYGWQIGKTGFTPVNQHPDRPINVGDLNIHLERLLQEGKAKEVSGKIEINLNDLGYNKLLGDGRITRPVTVHTDKCSEKAMEKISQAGGQVILTVTTTEPARQG
jgi:large subunit ribosomal protein L15